MNLYDKSHPHLFRNIIKENFQRKGYTYSLEHPSVPIEEYKDIFDWLESEKTGFRPTRYFIFIGIDDTNLIYFTFKNTTEVDVEFDINTGNLIIY